MPKKTDYLLRTHNKGLKSGNARLLRYATLCIYLHFNFNQQEEKTHNRRYPLKLKLSLTALALMGQTAAHAAPLLVDFDDSEREERVQASNAWLEIDTQADRKSVV